MSATKLESFRSMVSRSLALLSSLLGEADDSLRKSQAHRRAVELKHGYKPSSISGVSLILAVSIASISAVAIAVAVAATQIEPGVVH